MSKLADLTDPGAVRAAIHEFDQIGRDAFLHRYGFGRARDYFLEWDGRRYDSKAVVGAAYGYQFPAHGPLRREEFSGGESHAARRLRDLGFTVHGGTPLAQATGRPRFWALLAKPTIYDIESAVRDFAVDLWTTKGRDIRAGDRVLIWKAKGQDPVRGIVALGEVLTDPELRGWEDEAASAYWINPPPPGKRELRVAIRYVRPPKLPLWLGGPANDLLHDLTVSRGQGTVFTVTPEQWNAVVEAAGGWPDGAPEVTDVRSVIEEQAGKRSGGQGFQVSAEVRRAIEQLAMERAIAHYEGQGWRVQDVSATQAYDLHCSRAGGEELRVEVKGTTGDGTQVLLTPNEVDHARRHVPDVALLVVAGVEVTERRDGVIATSGGVIQVYEPWNVDAGHLMPLGFAHAPPTQ